MLLTLTLIEPKLGVDFSRLPVSFRAFKDKKIGEKLIYFKVLRILYIRGKAPNAPTAPRIKIKIEINDRNGLSNPMGVRYLYGRPLPELLTNAHTKLIVKTIYIRRAGI